MNSLNVIMNNINRYIFFVLVIDAFLFGMTKLLNSFIKR